MAASCSWTLPADGGKPITHYVLQRQFSGGVFTQLATTTDRAFVDPDGVSTTVYRVAAVNADGQGPWSNIAPSFHGSTWTSTDTWTPTAAWTP